MDVTERWNLLKAEEAGGEELQDAAPMTTPLQQGGPTPWQQNPSLTPLPSVLQGSPQ